MNKKNSFKVAVAKNAFIDKGDGRLEFPQGMTIIDGNELRNGYLYDMESMDVSEYQGQVTADHEDLIEKLIAGVEGVEKQGSRVIVRAINYLVNESALARLAYALAINPKVPTNFSVETYGPWPDASDDTYYKAKLIGLSQVVVGNSRGAVLNSIVKNSLEQSEKDGLDIEDLKPLLNSNNIEKDINKMFKTVKNSRDFSVEVRYKNAAEEFVTTEVKAGQSIDVAEDQASSVEAQINTASEKIDVDAAISNALTKAQEEFDKKLNEMQKSIANSAVTTPKFEKGEDGKVVVTAGNSAFADMDWRERTKVQVESFRKEGFGSPKLREINDLHKAQIEAEAGARNALDFDAFGNFVTAPELLTTIDRDANEYRPFADLVAWTETNSLKTGWLESDGGIILRSVEMCDDEDDGNLKPIQDYGTTPREVNLSEYASVSVVCSAATQFLAVDLLQDAALVYREAYDRKRAELIIYALQAAVNATGNKTPYVTNPAIKGITSLIPAWSSVKRASPNGTWIMNSDTEAILLQYAIEAGSQDPFALFQKGADGMVLFLGRPYVVVPNEIMPTINDPTPVTFEVAGQNVNITEGIFYADLNRVLARVGVGGFNYDLNTGAAYEVGSGQNRQVYSSYQRDQILLRGYTYAIAGVRRNKTVGSITATAAS